MNTKKDIGKLIAERLGEETVIADERQWDLIETRLNEKKKKRRWFLLGLLFLLLGGAGFLFLSDPSEKEIVVEPISSETEAAKNNPVSEDNKVTSISEEKEAEKENLEAIQESEPDVKVAEEKTSFKKKTKTAYKKPKLPDTTTVVKTTYHYYNMSTGEEINTDKKEVIDSLLHPEKKENKIIKDSLHE
ncbi:hypothetical protein POV27_04210 [Aureisphaera galaxeae]|uniref:hypothetical protein n=1 Tax=Aureisphaera galaxeae TaxID=1538023 RepID=UPI00234FD8AD|nr:hypothetical protein [Aureisphaera galaxeae]MDC8003239.1 hypothetical protein [Aureisphaera galaxeae]